jgi:hypothetical protein
VNDSEYISSLSNDPERLNIVINCLRPGARLFCVKLEYEHYDPLDPQQNDKFILIMNKWRHLLITIVSVPATDRHIVEAVAKETGMRLADGTPFMVKSDGVVQIMGNLRREKIPEEYRHMADFFPMSTANCFGLENEPKSLVYEGMVGAAHVTEYEEAKIDEIFAKFKQRWLLSNPGQEYPEKM